MARTTKPLTNTEIANAKPKDKKYPLTDGGGLFLLVKPNGAKLWRFNYYKPYTKNRTEKRMGYKGKLVAHGLRSIASTYLNEKGYNPELIEVALSHINQDRIRMAYNRADYIKQRFEILQAWADFIDECSQGALPQYHLKKVA